jgi:hypothetical protein
MAEGDALDIARKAVAAAEAALKTLSPEKALEQPAPAAPAAPAPVVDAKASRKRTILQTEGSAICTDCDTGEKLLIADSDSPDEIIGAMNKRHKHGDTLTCPTCRAATVKAYEEMGYEVRDEGPGKELRLIPKKK